VDLSLKMLQLLVSGHGGQDHITTMSHVMWDALQDDTCCTNGLLKTEHTKRFVVMTIESTGSVILDIERQVRKKMPFCLLHLLTSQLLTFRIGLSTVGSCEEKMKIRVGCTVCFIYVLE
jgi:hypothetical protein